MKYFLSTLVIILALFSFKNKDSKAIPSMKLVKIWESDTLFTTAESVLYEAKAK